MKHYCMSHCDGDRVVTAALRKQVIAAIDAVTLSSATIKPGLGFATKIRNTIVGQLRTSGWSGEVSVSSNSDMTITSAKDDIGLCLQTGNMSRIYADLIKLQAMYLDNHIKGAVIIVPSQEAAKLLGSNIAQAKRLERELAIFKKAYHVPTIVFALEV